MCPTDETKIGGIICSCLCTLLAPEERFLVETVFNMFKRLDDEVVEKEGEEEIVLTGREVFVLCEFFARKGVDLWPWGSLKHRPSRNEECILADDCLDLFAEPSYRSLLKTWLRIYMHEFFEPTESLPEMKETFIMMWSDFRVLLDFFLHHGGCLTNKFIF